jgi:hypothetical protein
MTPMGRRTSTSTIGPRALAGLAGVLLTLCLCVATAGAYAPVGARAASGFPCTGPGSAHRPCRFGTPSGDIRCLWTPSPDNVACVLRATGRAYRLKPHGRASVIHLHLARGGQTLHLNQQIVFPQSLSCRDTRTTMICNQDFGFGAFTLAPHGSHRS